MLPKTIDGESISPGAIHLLGMLLGTSENRRDPTRLVHLRGFYLLEELQKEPIPATLNNRLGPCSHGTLNN